MMADRFCARCGKPVGENDSFCSYCAAPIQSVQPQAVAEPQQEEIKVPENSAEIPPQYTMPKVQSQAQPQPQPQAYAYVPPQASAQPQPPVQPAPAPQTGAVCPVCGGTVYPQAVVCVHCGAPVSQRQIFMQQAGQKSRMAAGLFGIFLGCFGVHNFYLGYTGKAIAQLLLTVLLWCLVFPAVASAIWGLVEGIMILTGSMNTDAKGIPLAE